MRFGSVCSGIEAASVRGSKPYQQSAAAVPNVRWIGERIQRHLAGEL